MSKREALKVFPAPKIPWTQRVVWPGAQAIEGGEQ